MAQEVTSTKINRYAGLMTLAQKAWNSDRPKPKILSFGCSRGDEMITLASFFPEADIVGCDVDLEIASKRTDLPGPVFFSTAEAVAENGPYDIIFANSVLCFHPCDVSVPTVFPFDEFQALAKPLHESLNADGLLCLYNLSYLFRDLAFASDYQVVSADRLLENGFVPKWAKDGRKITTDLTMWPFRWHLILEPNLVNDSDFTDCVYCKTKSSVPKIMGGLPKNDSSKWIEQPPIATKSGAYVRALVNLLTGKNRQQ